MNSRSELASINRPSRNSSRIFVYSYLPTIIGLPLQDGAAGPLSCADRTCSKRRKPCHDGRTLLGCVRTRCIIAMLYPSFTSCILLKRLLQVLRSLCWTPSICPCIFLAPRSRPFSTGCLGLVISFSCFRRVSSFSHWSDKGG